MSEVLDAVTIPKWGIEMTHGTVVAWHKVVGDAVKACLLYTSDAADE